MISPIKIGFGGGCHWCTEGVFQAVKGVQNIKQGWISSSEPNNSFSEGVVLMYSPNLISLETLIEIHLLTHASSARHSMRDKYRSAIYTFNQQQHDQVSDYLVALQSNFENNLITTVLPCIEFKLNEELFLNYYQKQPEAPFCKTYITPKLKALLKTHKKHIIPPK